MILRLSKLRRIWLCLFDRLFWPLGTVYSWLARASLGKINTLRPATGYPRSPHVIWLKLVAMADFTCYKSFHFNTKNMYICITYHQNLFSITCLQNLWNLVIPRTTNISIINMQYLFIFSSIRYCHQRTFLRILFIHLLLLFFQPLCFLTCKFPGIVPDAVTSSCRDTVIKRGFALKNVSIFYIYFFANGVSI